MVRHRPTRNTESARPQKAAREKAARPNIFKNTSNPKEKPALEGAEWGRGRIWAVGCVFGLLWLGLLGRLFYLQIIKGPEFAARANRLHMVAEVTAGRRGTIFDRNGDVLARSVESLSISARPGEIKDVPGTAKFLADTLGMPVGQLRKLLTENKGFVWIARKVDDRASKAVREAKIPGVYLMDEFERVYPHRHSAGQLIGFVGVDNVGLDGLEAYFQNRLSGVENRQLVARDARGRRIYLDGKEEENNVAGQDLHLTLDLQVQFFAEEALAAAINKNGGRWGGCVVVDVENAEILAWAQYPFFNPNSYQSFSQFVRRDKLALDALEQGSTIKAFLMASALQEKTVTPDTVFDCEKGQWKFRNVLIRDTSPHGMLPAHKIFEVSSNIGCAKIGLQLGAEPYWGYLDRLGFGRKTGLPLVGENTGILRAPAQWHEVDLANASFGQSFSATALQMAQAYLCLASGGIKRPLKLVRSGENMPGQNIVSGAGEAPYRVYSEEVCRQVLDFMRATVEGPEGTGGQAAIPGLAVGGKTGTAQKADSTGRYGIKRVASFVGFVPIDEPRYLILTVIDEPVKSPYGGVVAAPAFRDVALRALAYNGYLPDPEDPLLAAVAAAGKLRANAQIKQDVKKRQELEAQEKAKAIQQAQKAITGPVLQEVNLDQSVQVLPSKRVPDVKGMGVRRALETFAQAGVVPTLRGQGSLVVRQQPEAGTLWDNAKEAPVCIFWLDEQS